MIDGDSTAPPLERVPTHVPGLDAVLRGGVFRAGVYMVLGRPGAGKTILGSQICFGHAAAGGRAIFLTLLAESHSRMIAHLSGLAFFEPSQIGKSLFYISGYEALEQDKLKGLLHLIRRIVREHGATLLVVDGLLTAGAMAQSDIDVRKFIHELQIFIELVGCTTFLLTGASDDNAEYPQRTMVDGLVELNFDPVGMGTVRSLEVVKFRGGEHLAGRHLFAISGDGITVHPRTEVVLGRNPARPVEGQPPLRFGIASLDAMVGGGLRAGSVTLLLGSPGTGKTLLGLAFLEAGARAGEPGLYFGFHETPDELRRKSSGVDGDLAGQVDGGLVELLWQPPLELIADALVEKLLAAVRQRGVRRVFLDELDGLKDGLVYPGRGGAFFTALCNELRSLGVTTILSDDNRTLFGPEIAVPVDGLAATLDNIVFLRHVELHAQLRRLISMMKMRERGDSSLREFSISEHGIEVSSTFDSAEAIVTGIAHEAAGTSPPRK